MDLGGHGDGLGSGELALGIKAAVSHLPFIRPNFTACSTSAAYQAPADTSGKARIGPVRDKGVHPGGQRGTARGERQAQRGQTRREQECEP